MKRAKTPPQGYVSCTHESLPTERQFGCGSLQADNARNIVGFFGTWRQATVIG
ncbi:hypothetical protein [Runella salmonicolor]|uniref:Uncharacterized protein n=1 Tax=Runella salmonicolor TaxID=2950278 RepID=A0ABT1FMR7_9BACT|nr:hypothetical protein [Runella salmonicolor]MCP1381812.1 hypothetical protein [Runella salmonicolor]